MTIFQLSKTGKNLTKSPAKIRQVPKRPAFCLEEENHRNRRSIAASYNAKRLLILEDALMVGLIRFPAS